MTITRYDKRTKEWTAAQVPENANDSTNIQGEYEHEHQLN